VVANVLERDLQVASMCELAMALEVFARAGWCELKRRKRRAPAAGRDLQVASACEVWTARERIGHVGLVEAEAA
jgi:hypothetical protein